MDLSKIKTGDNPPDDINVLIEVPLGGDPIKYEIDKDSGPIDVMVVGNRPLVPGSVVRARPVGVLMMTDDKGPDEKILAVPHNKLTSYYDKIATYHDLPQTLIDKTAHFFEHYKDLEKGKWTRIEGWYGIEKARELIEAAVKRGQAEGA